MGAAAALVAALGARLMAPHGRVRERDEEFRQVANERWATLQRTGESVPWDEAKAYLQARARGDKPPRPQPRVPAR